MPEFSPDRFSILIPYSDFLQIVDALHSVNDLKIGLSQLSSQYDALKSMYLELLEKIAEIDRIL